MDKKQNRRKLLKKLFPIGIFSNITERLKEIQKKREDEFDEAARAGPSGYGAGTHPRH